jgi:hypothetical protein
MKKLFIVLLLSSASVHMLNAQHVNFGFSAGAAFANYRVKVDNFSISADTKIGITGGVFFDIPVSKNFSFQPALNFVQKGTQYDYSDMGFTEEGKTTVNYLEIPLNVLFNYNVAGGTFFAGAGPSVAFALSGREKYDDGIQSYDEEISFGNDPDNDDMRGLDIGANILGGFRLSNGFFISTGFNGGLINLLPGGSDEGSVKSNYFTVRLGFLLKGGKKK